MDIDDSVVETLQPADFAVFAGYKHRGDQVASAWILGPDIIASFGMEVDTVDIYVYENGFLSIKPRIPTGCIGSFGAGAGFWSRTSELQLEAR